MTVMPALCCGLPSVWQHVVKQAALAVKRWSARTSPQRSTVFLQVGGRPQPRWTHSALGTGRGPWLCPGQHMCPEV